ncbi:MAG: hypothetical protein U0353_33395 [Sandaracinus sp.]
MFVALGACSSTEPPPDAAVVDAAAAPLQPVGGPCTSDTDCRVGLECFTGPPDARPWPEGYCTRACVMDDDCSGGGRCGPAYYDGTEVLRCLAPCEREAGARGGCREGYACAFDGVCVAGCTNDEQCVSRDYDPPSGRDGSSPGATCELGSGRCILGANPTAQHGDPCTENQDCGPAAACFGAAGCLNAQCDLGGERACPTDAVCAPIARHWDVHVNLCLPRCQPGVDGRDRVGDACAPGWACLPGESFLPALDTGACFPFLGPIGRESARMGPCTTDADCPNPLGFIYCDTEHHVCVGAFCAAPSLSGVPELACPPGGTCMVQDPAELAMPPSPADRVVLGLGTCVGSSS